MEKKGKLGRRGISKKGMNKKKHMRIGLRRS